MNFIKPKEKKIRRSFFFVIEQNAQFLATTLYFSLSVSMSVCHYPTHLINGFSETITASPSNDAQNWFDQLLNSKVNAKETDGRMK